MNDSVLYQAVQELAAVTQGLSDEEMDLEYAWRYQDEGLRFCLIGTYHELRDLAVTLKIGRQAEESPVSATQHVLAQYHAAFRELEAVLLEAEDDLLDQPPAEGEWPLRRILGHIIGAERVFFTLVHYGADQHRAGVQPSGISDDDLEALFGHEEEDVEDLIADGNLNNILAYYRSLHSRILMELAGLSNEEHWSLSRFWESEPLPARYRLHRFDAHLRQHTIQIEKTLDALGSRPTESLRLLRLVYSALAEAEGAVIGAPEYGYALREELAAQIAGRVGGIVDTVRKG